MIIGKFSYENGNVSGPADYMTEQGNAKIDSITSGNDAGFNAMLSARPDVDAVKMVLIALQTDYAGYIGMKQLHNAMK